MKKIISTVAILVILGGVAFVLETWSGDRSRFVIGGDKDAGGCLIAAGYSWCEAKKECIRPWEERCAGGPTKTIEFRCAESKSFTATFYIGDDRSVDLHLGEDFKISVPRAMSASGARYANADESFVFWNKGDTAFIEQNGTMTFKGCVAI